MNKGSINLAVIQAAFDDDQDRNWNKLTDLIHEAAAAGAQLVILPELHNGRYFCQHEDSAEFRRAEKIPGPSSDFLAGLAKRFQLVIVGSVFERRASGIYHNTAVILDNDGSLAGCYRKMHIPDDPGYYEKYYFTPGDRGFIPVDTSIGRLGVLVCWDQWFPEAARLMALSGAELLLYPTAIGWEPGDSETEKTRQLESWVTIQRSHAIANGIPVICANRWGYEESPSGNENGIEFWGNSFICGPQGEFLARCEPETDSVVTTSIDLHHSEQVRQVWPFLRDRRIDAYAGILERHLDPVAGDVNPAVIPTGKGEKS
jgi:N-carbamoylputrescine amidase